MNVDSQIKRDSVSPSAIPLCTIFPQQFLLRRQIPCSETLDNQNARGAHSPPNKACFFYKLYFPVKRLTFPIRPNFSMFVKCTKPDFAYSHDFIPSSNSD